LKAHGPKLVGWDLSLTEHAMIPTTRFFSAVTGLALVIGSGLGYGLLTGRWSPSAEIPDMSEQLERLPLEIGEWRGTKVDLPDTRAIVPVLGRIERRYTNVRTHDLVTVSLVCGDPGPICIHTPDVCYGSSGYQIGKCRKFGPPRMDATEFWVTDAEKEKSTEKLRLRIFWAWNNGEGWKAADNPRLEFASRHKLLYKLYLVRELPVAGDALEDDPCADLMRQLLPELNRTLFAPAS
jgi:hypothetical protein